MRQHGQQQPEQQPAAPAARRAPQLAAVAQRQPGAWQGGHSSPSPSPPAASRSSAAQASPSASSSAWARSGASPIGSEVASQYSVGPTRRAMVPRPRVPLIQ